MQSKKPKTNKDNYKKVVKIILGIIVVVFLFFFIKGGIPLKHYFIDLREFEINEAFPIDVKIVEAEIIEGNLTVEIEISPWQEDADNIYPILEVRNDDCTSRWYKSQYYGRNESSSLKIGQIETNIIKTFINQSFVRNSPVIGVDVEVKGDILGFSRCIDLDYPNGSYKYSRWEWIKHVFK